MTVHSNVQCSKISSSLTNTVAVLYYVKMAPDTQHFYRLHKKWMSKELSNPLIHIRFAEGDAAWSQAVFSSNTRHYHSQQTLLSHLDAYETRHLVISDKSV
jgi:hypothetical protein